MSSITEYTGVYVPAPRPHRTPYGRIALFLVVIAVLVGALLFDARAHYNDLPAPVIPCDPAPTHACPLVTSRGTDLLVYAGDDTYALATAAPSAPGERGIVPEGVAP